MQRSIKRHSASERQATSTPESSAVAGSTRPADFAAQPAGLSSPPRPDATAPPAPRQPFVPTSPSVGQAAPEQTGGGKRASKRPVHKRLASDSPRAVHAKKFLEAQPRLRQADDFRALEKEMCQAYPHNMPSERQIAELCCLDYRHIWHVRQVDARISQLTAHRDGVIDRLLNEAVASDMSPTQTAFKLFAYNEQQENQRDRLTGAEQRSALDITEAQRARFRSQFTAVQREVEAGPNTAVQSEDVARPKRRRLNSGVEWHARQVARLIKESKESRAPLDAKVTAALDHLARQDVRTEAAALRSLLERDLVRHVNHRLPAATLWAVSGRPSQIVRDAVFKDLAAAHPELDFSSLCNAIAEAARSWGEPSQAEASAPAAPASGKAPAVEPEPSDRTAELAASLPPPRLGRTFTIQSLSDPQPFGLREGDFLQLARTGTVYRVEGGRPSANGVTSWDISKLPDADEPSAD